MRKIGLELTSVANLPSLCTWEAATAWLDEQCVGPHPGPELANLRPLKRSVCNHYATGLAPKLLN